MPSVIPDIERYANNQPEASHESSRQLFSEFQLSSILSILRGPAQRLSYSEVGFTVLVGFGWGS